MNGLLILVILFLSANIVSGFMKGFLRVVYSMVGWILFCVFAAYATPYVSAWVSANLKIDASTLSMRALTFFIVLLIVAIAFQLIAAAVGLVAKLPLIGGVNHLLGGAAGFVKGMLFIWLIFAGISLCSAAEFGQTLITCIYQSPLLVWLYENNFLLEFLS